MGDEPMGGNGGKVIEDADKWCGLRSAPPVNTEIHDSGVARIPFFLPGKMGIFLKFPGYIADIFYWQESLDFNS